MQLYSFSYLHFITLYISENIQRQRDTSLQELICGSQRSMEKTFGFWEPSEELEMSEASGGPERGMEDNIVIRWW